MKKTLIHIVFTLGTLCLYGIQLHVAMAAAGDNSANKPSPNTIPCVPSLPCVTDKTQQSGEATRDYVLNTFGSSFVNWFLGTIGLTSVIFIIVGGVQLHLAFGAEDGIAKAKRTLGWAIGGLIISILAVAIVSIISKITIK